MVNGAELAEALAATLSAIPGVRVHAAPPDSFLPPGIVVQLPSLVWDTTNRTFDSLLWEFPVAVAVARTVDRTSQSELYRIVEAIGDVLAEDSTLGGVVDYTRLLNASPSSITSGGVDFPAYLISVQVIA